MSLSLASLKTTKKFMISKYARWKFVQKNKWWSGIQTIKSRKVNWMRNSREIRSTSNWRRAVLTYPIHHAIVGFFSSSTFVIVARKSCEEESFLPSISYVVRTSSSTIRICETYWFFARRQSSSSNSPFRREIMDGEIVLKLSQQLSCGHKAPKLLRIYF